MPKEVRKNQTRVFEFDDFNGETATYRQIITRGDKTRIRVSEPFYLNALDFEKLGRPKEITVNDYVKVRPN